MDHGLVADVGGTHTRLGLLRKGSREIVRVEQFVNRDFDSLSRLASYYLAKMVDLKAPKRACFAVACPVRGDRIALTNCDWSFSVEELRRELYLDELYVMNDFEAIARSLPRLERSDLYPLHPHRGLALKGQTMAVLGPGTGLGMGAAVPAGQGFVPLASEGGHAAFSPQDDTEFAIAEFLRREKGFVCLEDLLSGQGLENIYRAQLALTASDRPLLKAQAISERALNRSDPLAHQALHTFCAILGSAAGDIALTFGARGGLYLAGGILPRFIDFLEESAFRDRFEAKGSYQGYAKDIASYVIIGLQPGLVGAATYFED
jgi:glucokinase